MASHAAEQLTRSKTRAVPQPQRSTIQAKAVGEAALTTSTGVAMAPSTAPYPLAPNSASDTLADHPEHRRRERSEQGEVGDRRPPTRGGDLHQRGERGVVQTQPHAEAEEHPDRQVRRLAADMGQGENFRDRETIDVMPCKHCGSRNVTILWSPELQRYCLDCDASWDDNDLYETAARIWDEFWERFEKKHGSSSDDTESDG